MKSINLPPWWRGLFVPLVIILSSFILLYENTKASRCGLVMVIMAVLWVTEIIPLFITALIPVFAFPLLGVLPTKSVCTVYLKDSNMMFLGGLMMAAAVENSNLHERVALFVILRVGQSPRLLSLGFMIVTSFLSMWISNTSTAAMIVPIVDAVVKELIKLRELEIKAKKASHHEQSPELDSSRIIKDRYLQPGPEGSYVDVHAINELNDEKQLPEVEVHGNTTAQSKKENKSEAERESEIEKEHLSLKHMLFLSVAFAANTGGTGSPLGCGPNIVLLGILDSIFHDSLGLNFATWMLFNVPGVILCALLGWLWLQILFMYCGKNRVHSSSPERDRALKHFLEEHYRGLGRVSRREGVVAIAFVILVLLWVFRDPGFVTGWAALFPSKVHAATPVMLIFFLLFCIPATGKPAEGSNKTEKCMTWDAVHRRVPWGIILLMGGGLALAEGAKTSGLSRQIGENLEVVQNIPKGALQVLVCLLTATLTEFASNTATASILLPILTNLSIGIQVHPLYLLIPATACCAYAFMLPVATPGNAIILSASGMKTIDMMRAGIVMNIACILVTLFLINTLGYAIFDLTTLPTLKNTIIA